MVKRAHTLWFEAPGIARVREAALPEVRSGEVILRGSHSGLSAGTERLVLAGAVPEDARAVMRLEAMRGSFELPCAYGYALVGEIDGGDGAPVFALHPHTDLAVVRASDLRPLPRGVPRPRLTLAANLETAINVIWDAEIALGDSVLVSGLGVVGLLVAKLAKKAGAKVDAVEPSRARCELAATFGIHAIEALDPRVAHRADIAIDVSGHGPALAALVGAAGPESRVIAASWYAHEVTLPLGGTFHPNRVELRSSQVARISPKRARWSSARRWSLVGELLEDASLDALVATPVPLSEAPALYTELARAEPWCPPHRVFRMDEGAES